ncbi:MAG: multidrug ABC transporter ATP-binding protein [Pseudomonas fluorescens]|nr:MAG: multidrug ABC transporter ATP-binding protein [Pseudomonas fluorescens]
MPLLTATNLTKTFAGAGGSVTAVSGLTFEIKPGEVVGLMGPNGAGKSTTMRLLAGYLTPTAGEATINGHPVTSHTRKAQANIGYLAETPPQEDDLTPYHLLTLHARTHNIKNIEQQIESTSKLTRCNGCLHRPMAELSKGMKQRVHLACALIHNPPVLLLDEPTDGLDPNQKHELRSMLKKLAAGGKAILVSTHVLEEAEQLLTRVLILHRGQILLDTTPAALAAQGKGDLHLAFRVLTTNRAGE